MHIPVSGDLPGCLLRLAVCSGLESPFAPQSKKQDFTDDAPSGMLYAMLKPSSCEQRSTRRPRRPLRSSAAFAPDPGPSDLNDERSRC
jgi:hypothetical protein